MSEEITITILSLLYGLISAFAIQKFCNFKNQFLLQNLTQGDKKFTSYKVFQALNMFGVNWWWFYL